VECLDAATEHSGRTILEMGARLGDVMTQGLQLRTLMQEVSSLVGTSRTAELAGQLGDRGRSFRELATQCDEPGFGQACSELEETLQRESVRLLHDDRRRQAEVLTLTGELGALTGTMLTQTGQAISALQFQDPAIQELRRIDSLVLELRQAIDADAEAVKWGHRVGDAKQTTGNAPEELASRALAIKEDTRRRVETFESQTNEAVAEVRRVHANLRSVTHAQVAKSHQTAQTLDPGRSEPDSLQRYCTSLGAALSRLEDLIQTGQQVTGNLSRILELSESALETGYDRRSSITVASHQVSAIADTLGATDDSERLAVAARDQLADTQHTLEALLELDRRIRSLAGKVESQLEGTRTAFAAFAEPLTARESDPVPQLLKDASQAASRMFDVIVEEFRLDPSAIDADTSWQEQVADQPGDDVGLILL